MTFAGSASRTPWLPMTPCVHEVDIKTFGERNWCGVPGPTYVLFEVEEEERTRALVYHPERNCVLGGRAYTPSKELLAVARIRWGHLARTDEQRWWYHTEILNDATGCVYWLGAMHNGQPRFSYQGRTVNARNVPWSCPGRRTCRNPYCVRKQHSVKVTVPNDARAAVRAYQYQRFRVTERHLAEIRARRKEYA